MRLYSVLRSTSAKQNKEESESTALWQAAFASCASSMIMQKTAKILIVDDEPFNISVLEQELDDLGYDTISAANGQEALDQIAAAAPDLVLLDVMMPIMDG